MVLSSGGYFFAFPTDRKITSFKTLHSHSYSKGSRSLNLGFASHRKVGPRYIIVSDNIKNYGAVRAGMKAGERDQLRPHRQLQTDLAHEIVSEHQLTHSIGGSIHGNYDLLLRHNLHITGELVLAVSHCLLANHGVKLQDLNTALAQCEKTLRKLGLVGEAASNTAVAAKQVAEQKLRDKGALATSSAAQIYGLNILAPDMQDDSNNVTRFLVLAREPLAPGTDRISATTEEFANINSIPPCPA
ncbi:hypothetical protein V6N12_064526 [Hibiscus sabdariffa]|uniref:Prephenate dehydratase domain-containing protein n=1 Tax=Hibiscus sabdariffa TaxID=183260 RepID=A0ABR2G622_9ROSI